MKINVASWNIWVYGPRDFKGIAKFIKENKIDIIGIQEAAIYYDKDKTENIAEQIAKELNFNHVFYPAIDVRPQKPLIQGNAILSKFPIIESNFYQLNPQDVKYDGTYQTEPRILVTAKIDLNKEGILNFLTTHLQFSVRFETTPIRQAQVEKILVIIRKLEQPVVLTGDFNTTPQSEEIRKIENLLTRVNDNEPTWTVYPWEKYGWRVDNVEYRLDNIFVSKDLTCQDFETINSKISDHLPVKATINI